MAYTIVNKYIPVSKYSRKAPYSMKAETITFHNTANDATAIGEISYMTNNNNQTSYHVAIDDKHVVQAIPFSRSAWHAGDGMGAGNRKSIGIEVCYSKSGGPKYAAAEANAIEYIAHILKDKGWGIDRVKWHRDWSGKNCPHRVLDEGRATSVRNRIVAKLAELKGEKVVQVSSPSTERNYLLDGDTGDKVRALQSGLKQAGHSLTVDGIWGSGTESTVKAFQRSNNLTVDGIWGTASQAKLNAILANLNKKPVATIKEEVRVEYKKDAQPSASLAPEFKDAVEDGITDGTYPQRLSSREEVAVMVKRGVDIAVAKILSELQK